MTNHNMRLTVPPFKVTWFPRGVDCADAEDGDLILMDHGTWEDDAIEVAQELLTLSEPDLKGYTWCAHTAYVRGIVDGEIMVSEMGPSGYERRPLKGYTHRQYAVVHFNVDDITREQADSFDEACQGLDYGWFQYPAIALDDLTGVKLACSWGDTIICSTHCTMVLMGLGLFPDRPPAMVVPARMAQWFKASKMTAGTPTQITLTPGIPRPNG